MSDEYENPQAVFSPFWPLLVLMSGMFIWSFYQVYATNSQRAVYHAQFEAETPTIQAAQNWQTRYNAMMKDLIEVGGKDATAAPIAKEAIQAGVNAGLIRVNQQQPATNTAATPAAPDASSSSSK